MKKIIFLIYLIFLFISCSKSKNILYEDTCELISKNCVTLHLDAETSQETSYLQLHNDSILCFVNEYNNSLKLYNINTGDSISTIFFNKEGNNGIGTLRSFFIESSDSIYLYNYWTQMIYLSNAKSEITKKYKLDILSHKTDDFFPPSLYPKTSSPLYKLGDQILISGFNSFEPEKEDANNTPSSILYNITNGDIDFVYCYPSIYHKGNWGGRFSYRAISYTINNDQLVINYSAADSIYVENLKTNKRDPYYAASKYSKDIYPISNKREIHPEYNEEIKHYLNNTSYESIYYDKYEDVYYRLVGLPEKSQTVKDGLVKHNLSVIILSKDFNIIGETKLPTDNYKYMNCFVSKEGLHIQVPSDNDDLLIFKTFKVAIK